MKKASKKEIILDSAFRLFLTRGYDAVTIADIEYASQISRGLIFYHFENKQDMFVKAMNKYVFSFLENRSNLHLDFSSLTPLKDFMESYVNVINHRMQHMLTWMEDDKTPANFFRLILFLKGNYPDLEAKISLFDQNEERVWTEVLCNAIERKEISPSTDVQLIVSLFRHSYIGLGYRQSLLDGLRMQDLTRMWDIIYKSISNK